MSKERDLARQSVAYADGDVSQLDDIAPVVYERLRHMARLQFKKERKEHTLQPTALVNEVFIRLMEAKSLTWENRGHFYSIAAQMMRRVLINHAEARKRLKRGGGDIRITFDENVHRQDLDGDQLLRLDEALKKLMLKNERQGRVVELRYFAGLSVEETASALKCSPATVKRDWIFARAWLYRELSKE